MSTGLKHAPITKYLLSGIIINSTVASILNVKHLFHVQLVPHISVYFQIWRLLIWQLVYANAGEVLFSSLSLYALRDIERHLGSIRFAAFTSMSFALSSLIAPLVLAVLRPILGSNVLASGLTPTIFAILYQYHALIPSTYSMKVSLLGTRGWSISNKVLIYAFCTQLATSNMPGSLIGAVVGWCVGAAYHVSLIPRDWRLPGFMTWWIDSKAVNTTIRTRPAVQDFRVRGNERVVEDVIGTLAGTNERPDLAPPAETDVQTLMSMMNVTREEAVHNLTAANNSLERAAENMLQG